MRRRHVILGLVVLGFAVMAAVLHGRWQLADRPPQRYAECESNVAGADCARASEVFEDCRKGRVDQIGRFNCGRVIDLHSACGRRKGASDDLTCGLVAHDYLRCAVSGHGASACFAIEQAFLGCLDDGRQDVPACKADRGERMDCLYARNLNKERCRLLNDVMLSTPLPSRPPG